jgi:hypothetical protein
MKRNDLASVNEAKDVNTAVLLSGNSNVGEGVISAGE